MQETGMKAARAGAWRALAALALCLAIAGPARAEDRVWISGHVLDRNNRPVANALVAVYDDANKVVDYTRTDDQGEYALAVPKRVLHLQERHGQGFVSEVFGTAMRFVGDAAGFVANPVRAGVRAVTSTEAANFADPLTRGGIAVGGAAVDQVLFAVSPKPARLKEIEARKRPGAFLMKVVVDGQNDMVGVGRVYWLQRERFKAGGKEQDTLAAWLDPVRVTPTDSDRPSEVQSEYMIFKSARLVPSIAEPGARVHIQTKMAIPSDPHKVDVVVVARNNRTGQMWELQPLGEGRFEGEFEVDKRFPRDDQTISILAYAASQPVPGRRRDVEGAIEHAGLWNVKQPYIYDPLLVVSRNRADLTLTVVIPEAKKK